MLGIGLAFALGSLLSACDDGDDGVELSEACEDASANVATSCDDNTAVEVFFDCSIYEGTEGDASSRD